MRLSMIVPLSMLLVACNGPDDHDHPQLRDGEALYDAHCAACHRDAGDGSFLKGVPPVRYTAMTYRQMVDHILGHRRSDDSRMPRFPSMPKTEAEAIAIFVRQKLAVQR